MGIDAVKAAETLRKKNRKIIHLPYADIDIEIISLMPYDFIEAQGELDIPASTVSGKDKREIQKAINRAMMNPALQKRYMNFILSIGVLNPKIINDTHQELSEDEIYIRDLGRDTDFVLNEIISLSGLGEETEVVQKFRTEETEEPVDAGSNGEAIRAASE